VIETTILTGACAMLSLGWWVTLRRESARRRGVEEGLREVENRSRETLENIQLIGVRLDPEGCITFCNDFFLNLVGWCRDEIMGASWFDRFIPPDQGTVIRVFKKAIRAGNMPVHYQNDILTRSGERRFISWNNTVLRDARGSITAS